MNVNLEEKELFVSAVDETDKEKSEWISVNKK